MNTQVGKWGNSLAVHFPVQGTSRKPATAGILERVVLRGFRD
jgi:hypothetical protein